MKRPTPFRRHLLALSLLAAIGSPSVASAAQYRIEAGSLSQALTRFAAEAGISLQFSPALTQGLDTPGLNGEYGIDQGIATLLAGTGLQARPAGNGVYVLVKAPAERQEGGLSQLPVVVVSTTGEDPNSYGRKTGTTALPFASSLRETPQSVTVITSQMMEDKRIDNLVEVIEHTPGISISRYESNRGSLFARGFNINNYLIDGVPTTIDEQWSAGEVLSGTALYDRVEVLRGSDGLMTGIGNPSAVINMVRKKADSKTLTGSLSVERGSWSHNGVTADVSLPLSPSGATRALLVVDHDSSDSYIQRLENRQNLFYATVEQDVGDRTLLSAGISRQENETDSPTWGGVPAWQFNDTYDAASPFSGHRSQGVSPDWSYWNSEYTNWFVNAEHRLGDKWKAKARYTRGERDSESKIAILYHYPIDPATGNSGLCLPAMPPFLPVGMCLYMPLTAGIYEVEVVKDDLNLQVSGEFSVLGRRNELAFGYDRSKERFASDGQASSGNPAIPDIRDFDGSMPEPGYVAKHRWKQHEITQNAYYVANRVTLAEPLKLIVGARRIDYEVADQVTPANSLKFGNEVVPYAGLVLDLTRNLSAYASHTSVFQPQNYYDENRKLLAPIEGNTREYGLKGEFFDKRLNASISTFRMRQDNVAQYVRLMTQNGLTWRAYEEADGALSKGWEAEVSGEITPNWKVYAGYGKFKARLASGTNVNPLQPRKSFTTFTSYQLPGALKALTVGGGVRWQSETWQHQALARALGLPKTQQKSYAVADLMLRYAFSDQWSAQLNVNNVLDEKYFAATDDGLQAFWGEPRNATLSVKYQF